MLIVKLLSIRAKTGVFSDKQLILAPLISLGAQILNYVKKPPVLV